MKKTTKFLLVLAAVVAMTIGAVSTVMAADRVVATWEGSEDDGWVGYDADGVKIMRGWAESADSGRWYYFVNGKMATNRFVKTNNKTYYVGEDGAMATGWFEFNKKLAVNYNGANYTNVADAFTIDSLIGEKNVSAFTDKTQYATVWCYFNEDGTLAYKEWKQVDGIWYYFDGPFCLISEYHYNIKDKDGKSHYFGFDASGAVLAGWVAVPNEETIKGTGGKGPNDKADEKKTNYTWTYYGAGCEQVGAGWLNLDGDWFYMVADEKAGFVALTDTYLVDESGSDKDYYYYFNESGYMVKGDQTFNGGKDGRDVNVLVKSSAGLATGSAIKVAKDKSLTLSFDENGALLTGIVGNEYYEDGVAVKYAIKAATNVITKNEDGTETKKLVVVYAEKMNDTTFGSKYTGSFLMVDKDGKVRYFDNGVMVKADTVVFGENILAFDKDGVLVGEKAANAGDLQYVKTTTNIELGKVEDGKNAEGKDAKIYTKTGELNICYSKVSE